jgi:hypothetical protein
LVEADLADEAEELLDVADEEECELAVGLGEPVVGGSVGFFDAVAVGVAEADFDAVAEGAGEGLLLGGGLLGGGLLGGGLLGGGLVGGIGSGLQIGPVPAAEAAA